MKQELPVVRSRLPPRKGLRNDVSPLLTFCGNRRSSFTQARPSPRHFSRRLLSHLVLFLSILSRLRSSTDNMRLFLIPISTRRALIYARPLQKDRSKELSLLDRATSKAAATWASWEDAEKGWKKRLVTWGNGMQQRIPFEEWGLKSIPSLNAQRRIDEQYGNTKIDVLFPGNAVQQPKIPTILHTIATERQEFHRKKMLWSFGIAPLTAPFGLIPVYLLTTSGL